LDRQRDDHLGRKFHLDHRREILRAIWRAKSDTNCNHDANSNCYGNTS
jgi:hypothetical protein